MKRLTMKDENGCFLIDKTATVTWNSLIGENRYRGEAVDRLAAIEDILGDEYELDRLREIVGVDREGRCFISDVKLGGEVFYIPQFNGKPYCGIRKGHVQAVSFTKAGKRIKIREYHAHNQDFMLGKTVFLTYEATEAALKAREQDG